MKFSNEELVEGLRNGNLKVLHALYDKYEKRVRRFVMNNSGTEEESKDLWQDTLVIVRAKIMSGKYVDQNIHGYLTRIYKNQWLAKLRKRKRRPGSVSLEQYEEEIKPKATWGDPIWESLVIRAVGEHFFQLSEACQRIMELKFEKNKAHKEIAEMLSITADSSRVKLARCIKHLKTLCQSDPNFPSVI